MIYRLLEANEYEKLQPIWGMCAPNPNASFVAVAEKAGRIVGTESAHLQLHLDHFWIGEKSFVDWRRMWDVLEDRIPRPNGGLRVYAAPSFENGKRMCEILGFKIPEVPVMVKEY